MAVFRVERTRDYTVMSNHHLRDKNLSLKAKGLLSQMLSLPEDWDYTLAGLSRINRESKDAIRPLSTSWKRPVMSSAARPPMPAASSVATSTSSTNARFCRSHHRGGPSLKNRRRKTRQRIIRQRENRHRKIQRN